MTDTTTPAIEALCERKQHDLKCWPDVFALMLSGEKTAEFRPNDRDFKTGDTLLIREWSPETKDYSGRSMVRTVTHVLKDSFGVPDGFAVLSLAPLATELAAVKAQRDAMREALERSRQGWENALELKLLPERHRDTARNLAEQARAALASTGAAPAIAEGTPE